MTQEPSIWELVLNAGLFVKTIMLILLAASVLSWFMIVQRMFYFNAAYRAMLGFENQFWSGVDLADLYREGNAAQEQGRAPLGLESIFRAGFREYTRLRQQGRVDTDAVMEGSQRAMRVALSREEERMDKHLPFLATVGSTSPYVGLLGTVWGIMGSFQGLASMHTATLAAVAPGISEALVATAMGLFAAIPAVVAYNRFSAKADGLGNQYATFAEEFSSILHRDLHGRGQ